MITRSEIATLTALAKTLDASKQELLGRAIAQLDHLQTISTRLLEADASGSMSSHRNTMTDLHIAMRGYDD